MQGAWVDRPTAEGIIAGDLCRRPNARLVAGAHRAGGTGILDVAGPDDLARLLDDLARRSVSAVWLRPGDALAPTDLPATVTAVVLDGDRIDAVAAWAAAGARVVAEVVSRGEAADAVAAGAAGLISSGAEAGGRVGDTEAFVLLQQLLDLDVPVWARGGIGLHTAAAAVAGGAAGVVLDAQLALVRESGLGAPARRAVTAMDGSETRVVGGRRFYTRPDLDAATLPDDLDASEVARRLGPDLDRDLLPVGQDGACAAGLADRFGTVGGVVQAVAAAVVAHRAAAHDEPPLAPGAGVAVANGTRYPIAQGPMTRVSDRAAFALAVAEGGGLPFLALALMPGPEVRALLEETRDLLGDLPWGVGVLGFVPPEIRAEQLEVVHDVRPRVALIAGGRPSQAQPLEDAGISTYLHVPSPGLLDRFLKDGARKFVFEGRECGGHVGPRSSFALWDAQIERLLAVDDPQDLQLLFAGGIHDARSAAMAATAAAPLAARGAAVGVLMGTAYLFTEEAVQAGAIMPAFQDVAVHCDTTVLLETSPGHATRCVETDYVRAFEQRRAELEAAGTDPKERWAELETLNLGRLRMASKGLTRSGDQLVELDEDAQRRDGMYMIGEVATLRTEVTTVAALHADVSEGSTALLAAGAPAVSVRDEPRPEPLDIAIIGMDAFMPGVVGADEFWAAILAGRDMVTEVPATRWDTGLYYDADAFTTDAGRKTPSRWGGFLRGIGFDPLRYGIPPASLAAIEPVQLLSLEVAARALADAGYATRAFDRDRASVIFGAESGNELAGAYGVRAFLPQLVDGLPPELEEWLPSLTEDSFPGVLTNVIAGRIANRLDLGGVNFTVDAACASSLTAVDAACKELRAGVSDLVVCGGADLHNGLNDYLLFASVHALSPTGRCKTFDASADGIALGEGIACVVLKRRADAERDGDRIYAVIDAVAGSSDGRHLGLTAPRKEGQQRAVERALAISGRSVTEIGLVEAHGTGTVVGDRTELATLTEMYAEGGAGAGASVLGSVKSQIGHTKCAAGLAGLIKVARAVHHGVLPPTIGISEPNPYYDPEKSPFRFLDRAVPWPSPTRRAAVSAFGFGGTNFHAVLSAPDGEDPPAHGVEVWPAELFLFRAATRDDALGAVRDLATLVADILRSDPDGQRHRLRDLAATVSAAGRGPVQVAVVADDLAGLATALATAATGTADPQGGVFLADPDRDAAPPTVAFLYPGQGSQRPAMGGDVFVAFPWLHDILRCGARWTDVLFPPAAFGRDERAAQQAAITATDVAQPTLGMVELALTRVLDRLGVTPDMAGGHSYGELAALAAAGALDDATLLDLSAARGGAILDAVERSGGDPGTMAAVEMAHDALVSRLAEWPDLVVANHNGPTQAVISGPTAAVEAAAAALESEGVRTKVLPVACAFHSPLIGVAGDLLAEHLAGVEIGEPTVPVYANSTAAPYPAGGRAAADLLAAQVASPVRFVEQIDAMYAAGARVFVEVGPGRVLTQQVRAILGDRPHAMVACDVSGEHGVRRLLLAAAELATLGVDLDPTALFDGRADVLDRRSLPVPAPGWLVDGAFVRTADGQPVPNSLQPADELPRVALGSGPGGGADDAVHEYLQNMRRLVAAERDVMLAYLGAEVVAGPAFDDRHRDAAIATTATVAGADDTAAGGGAPAVKQALSGDALMAAVLAIVSDRTGYPVEMLDPDLDLEADLSIDSIKRIEIVGELAEKVGLPGMDESAVDESLVEELAQLKTLRGIVAWIDALDPGPDAGAAADRGVAATDGPADDADAPAVPARAQRYEVRTVSLGPAVPFGDLAGTTVAVVGDASAVSDALGAALAARGATVRTLPARPDDAPDATERAVALGEVDAVVDLTTATATPGADARSVFADLRHAVLGAATRVLAVTVPVTAAGPSGVPGLMRALAREFPDAVVRSVEVDDVVDDPSRLAEVLADELLDRDAPAALSWAGGRRTTTAVVGPVPSAPGTPDLDADAVVVVTGGARGITARVAEGLARATGCRLVLVGRSPLPGDEDPRTAGATDRAALRQALMAIGDLTRPAEIEAACGRIEADREIRATLARLAEAGSLVEYHAVDVRDAAFGELLADVRSRLGRLDGIVCGAGVLDDRFVRDKTTAGFDAVFGTKVEGATTALAHAGPDTRFVVLFGSVSGVFGNRGQSDYGAANDALDALARAHAGRGTHVVSVDWGPWAGGGMVSPELEREYARRGIGLVDPADGVALLLAELAHPGPPQIVVMRGEPAAFDPTMAAATADEDLAGGVTAGD